MVAAAQAGVASNALPGPLPSATTPDLHHAAKVGDLDAVRAAVVAGADVNEVQLRIVDFRIEPETPLFVAAEAGEAEVVRYLLNAGADPDIRCLEEGTALTIAAARPGTIEVLRLLLDAGADVLGPRPNGMPALGWSARNGDLESFLLLLDASRRAGIEPEDEARIVKNLQHRSDELRHVMKRALTWKPESAPRLHVAARDGAVAEVDACLAAGESATASDEEGWMALHWAALSGDTLKARILLEAGADPNATSRGGLTPLMLAARLSDPELAVLLLDVGAEPSAADENGRTALHVAAWNAGPEMIWALLEHGADPGRTLSPSEQTPAMLAGRRKESYGVDVRWAFEGRTPPEYATVSDQVELAIDRPAPAIECTRTEMERSPELPFVLVNISLKVEPFPLDLAFDVSLRQRGAAFPANPLVVPAGTAVDGQAFQVFAPSLEPGSIELLLRPSRDVAVRKLPRPTAIWGGEVMLRCELVEKR